MEKRPIEPFHPFRAVLLGETRPVFFIRLSRIHIENSFEGAPTIMQMDSFTQVFEMVCDFCKQEITDVAYNLWIACIDPVSLSGDHVTLSVRSQFQKDIIENKYTSLLGRAFESVLGFPVTPVSYTHLDVYKRQDYRRRR